MPYPKNKRTVVLQSSLHASAVASLCATLEATFTTENAAVTTFDDASADANEKTRYRTRFLAPGGGDIGDITIRLIARGDVLQDDVAIDRSMAREEIHPPPEHAAITLLESPTASFERVWKQAALDREDRESVDHLCTLDVRVGAARGFSVGQTITTQDDDTLVLEYRWQDANGSPVVAGSVTLDTSASAGADHRLGRIRVTDNDPTTGEDRFG